LMDWKMPGMDGLKASAMIKAHTERYGTPRVIMVTAYGREEVMKQAEKIGLEGFLLKPVTPSLLFDTIMAAFGKEVLQESKAVHGEEMVEGLKSIQGARVLVVEDNEINQQVAQEILEGAGLVVDIADDGQKGLEAVQQNPYDLVLMDIQMPVMDGYTAAREIRNLKLETRSKEGEISSVPHPASDLPIVAMTANAMAGDREKAIDAGMNDHVAKPIDVKALFSSLLRFVKPGERVLPPEIAGKQKNEEKEAVSPLPELGGIDTADGLARVGGNKKLYRKILKKFRAGNEGVMEKIRAELDQNDLDQAERLVHGVKGASGNIGATELFESARILDDALKLEKTDGLDKLVEGFSSALGVALGSIAEFEDQEEKSGKDVPPEPALMDMNRVREIITSLKELLEDDDAEATNLLDSLREQLKMSETQLQLQGLDSHIAGYDFEKALDVLGELARNLKMDF